MDKTLTLIGTEKQVRWAHGIRQQLQERYPGIQLPDSPYAEWWIEVRNLPIEQIVGSQVIRSPFTSQFPRYTRSDVEPLLRNMGTFVVLDTETSGITKDCEIVELAIVALQSGDILFNSLLQPHDLPAYLTSKAREIHTIPEGAIRKAPTLWEKWDEISSILARYHPVAYNAAFDFPMIRRSAARWRLPTPEIVGTCAMKLFSAYMGSDDYYKLSEACTLMGIDQGSFGVAHTALADTLATCELLRRMQDMMTG